MFIPPELRPSFTIADADIPTTWRDVFGRDQHWHFRKIELNTTFGAATLLQRHSPELTGGPTYRPRAELTAAGFTIGLNELPTWLAPAAAACLLDVGVTAALLEVAAADAEKWTRYYTQIHQEQSGSAEPAHDWSERNRQLRCLAAVYTYADPTVRAFAFATVKAGFAGTARELHDAVNVATTPATT